ncbi:MAG: hypothetical protein RMJ44_11960, partial [Cytophagales bacterium]|nr:hypothetical protein [Cytophagales bacterium]
MNTITALKALVVGLLLANSIVAADYYWVHPSGPASANWSNPANWRTTSGGATAHTTLPTASDNVIFDANSFSTTGLTVVVDVAATCANITWTGATNNPTFAINNPLTIHGNLTFITGMAVSGTGTVTFAGGNTQTITMAGKSFGGNVIFNKDVGTTASLADAFATSGDLIFTQGDFHSNNHSISAANFSLTGSNARNVNLGTSMVNLSGTSFLATATAAAVLTSNNATFNFTNTTAAITVDLGSAVGRTFGNFVFAATTSARNITL